MPLELDAKSPGFAAKFARLMRARAADAASVDGVVAKIVADVRRRGDAALVAYTNRFDRTRVTAARLRVGPREISAALKACDRATVRALELAAERIAAYHARQWPKDEVWKDHAGLLLGWRWTPLDSVGLYVPGGRAAYPSSVLMNALPAKVAGVGELIMVTPMPRGERNPLVLAAAHLAGVDRVFAIGGAQAVAALAYGTQTLPQVDKIVGPGNAYVASAKRRVFGTVGIDMVAGPSEVLIIADGSSNPDWVAMDLFAQAEHDELAQSILLCPDAAYLDAVAASIARLLSEMPRREVIAASLSGRGALIQVTDLDEACVVANRIAPEHLELSVAEPQALVAKIRHAGAIFIGPYASESLGDYCAGPNHVLPTSRSARFSSPLGVYDFQKRTSLIDVSAAGARSLGPVAAELAYGEGLTAHARAAEMRYK